MIEHDISLAILAGGKSTRFNSVNKALLPIDNHTFLHKVVEQIESLFDEKLLITNRKDEFKDFSNFIITEDLFNNAGPLAGIYTALKKCKGSAVFILACDMPYVQRSLIEKMIGLFQEYKPDVLMPLNDGKIEPLHAIYSQTTKKNIEKVLRFSQFPAIRDFFYMSNIHNFELDESERNYVININSLSEYQQHIHESRYI